MVVGSAFAYSSIDSSRGDIRVLNIYPGNQADDLNLTFDILRITDDSELDFEAISYRWGSPNGEQPTSLNGRLFTLTLNQDQMIRNLREAQNIRRVWIDALCINQSDIIERNGQVQLMRRIYSNARCVPIYLDYEVDESSNAYKKFLSFTSNCTLDDLLKEDISFWRQICNALKAEYFGRVWVQQEMSLAKQLTLQCRKTLMPMICLANFLETWNSIFPLVINGEAKIDIDHPLFDAPDAGFMNILQGVDTFQKERLDFITLLTRSGHLKCTDERDRIYGVMFLARNWCEGYLIANYSLPVSDAFREAMASYLQNYRSISFLENAYFSYEGFEDIEDQTPSWVPDWRKPTLLAPIPSKIESKIETPRIQEKIEYPLVAHTLGNVLYTTGIKITKVRQHYSNMLGQTGLLSAPIRDFWAAFNNIVQNTTQPTDPEARTRYLLWLLVDRGKIQPDPVNQSLNEVLELFTQYFNLTLQFLTDNDDGNAAPSPDLGELRNFLHEVGAEEGSKAGFMLEILNRLAFNQSDRLMPFISEAGSIGLAPPHTEPGDELWLIPTCECPIILRPKNGRHIVLGNSWHENDTLWEQCGGMQNFFTKGGEIGGYKIEALCLE